METRDNNDWTALYHAVYWGHKSTVRMLVNNGANINAYERTTGKTPLMCAAEMGDKGNLYIKLSFV